jgi:hypothetical protein
MTNLGDENISFFFNEEKDVDLEQDNDYLEILNEIEKINQQIDKKEDNFDNDPMIKVLNYQLNYNVKQLLLICDYYSLSKDLRTNKSNKDEIIHVLVIFESDPNNTNIVLKRQTLWFYMSELKNDKFMKKFIMPTFIF